MITFFRKAFLVNSNYFFGIYQELHDPAGSFLLPLVTLNPALMEFGSAVVS